MFKRMLCGARQRKHSGREMVETSQHFSYLVEDQKLIGSTARGDLLHPSGWAGGSRCVSFGQELEYAVGA